MYEHPPTSPLYLCCMMLYAMKVLEAMPEDKTKFTVLIDRSNATAANQDVEMVKAMSSMYQVCVGGTCRMSILKLQCSIVY